MRILVLGASGMLGHELVSSLAERHDVAGTLRRPLADDIVIGDGRDVDLITGVDALNLQTVERAVRHADPDAIVNAIGVIKQVIGSDDEQIVQTINARFPHQLAELCREPARRVVHLSTDCVFSGTKGMYRESDDPDATDLYGLSKRQGELHDPGCITLRTSMIGLELHRHESLVDWFLAQQGPIRGFRRAIFSGFTTRELARIIERILVDFPDKHGLYHVSSEPIDKFSLLCGLRDRLGLDTEIQPYDDFECDRSLDSTRFRTEFGYTPPSWDRMLDELSQQIKARRE